MGMLSSGIPELDRLLGGGVEEGRIVLVETVGGLGEEIAMSFLLEALKKEEKVFVILEKRKVRDVKNLIKKNELKEDSLSLIVPENNDVSVQELFTITDAVRKCARSNTFGVFQLLSPLLIIHDVAKVYSMFVEMSNFLRDANVTVVFTIDKTLSDRRVIATFEETADVVIEVEEIIDGFKITRGIRVKKNPMDSPTEFYELRVKGNSVEIGERIL